MKSLVNAYKGKPVFIICPGKTIKEYRDKILRRIVSERAISIGINAAPELFPVVSYHLWTNNQRIEKHGRMCGVPLIGKYIKEKNRPKQYILINYTDRDKTEDFGYVDGVIKGYYRTSGCLAVMIAHLMGAGKIYLCGMDGFTYHTSDNPHFYSFDKSEFKTKSEWAEYDRINKDVLSGLSRYGIDFKIITPTIFKDHYENTLGISE